MARYSLRPGRAQASISAAAFLFAAVYWIVYIARVGNPGVNLFPLVGIALLLMGLWLWHGIGPGRGFRVEVDDREDPPRGWPALWGMTSERIADGRYRIRPRKASAVVTAVVMAAALAWGVATIHETFALPFAVFAVVGAGSRLWSAFGRGASPSTLDRYSRETNRSTR